MYAADDPEDIEELEVTVVVANVPEKIYLPCDATVFQLAFAVSNRTGILTKALSFRFSGKLLDKPESMLSFYRVRTGCKIYARVKLLPGLDCLGPFAIEPNIQAKYDMAGAPYIKMIGPKDHLNILYDITGERNNFFQISPKHKVTLPDDIRTHAHIPLGDNVYFCWIYPLVKTKHSTADKIKTLDTSNPLIALILFGGFLYVDHNDKVIQVNGVKPGPGLYFDGPYKMNSKCFDMINRYGRFQEITVQLEGCKSFCWFLPGEDVAIKKAIGVSPFTDDNEQEIGIPHGAFGYECGEDNHRVFRISDTIPSGNFPVTEFASLSLSESTHESESVDAVCVVCLEPYGDGEQQRMVNKPCLHACMHLLCANQLLSASSIPQCPICRADVVSLERMPYI